MKALTTALILGFSSVALASPPPWAPAHGHRAKHGDEEVKQEKEKERETTIVYKDIKISTGSCNREAIGTVLGGVVGGVVGNEIGKKEGNQDLGVVLGTIAGAVIGNRIGKQMDEADRQCSVQVFEQAKNGQTVTWKNPNGTEYRMTPVETYQRNNQTCRKYVSEVRDGDKKEKSTRQACQVSEGSWKVTEL